MADATWTIGTTGKDYTALETAEAAKRANLVTTTNQITFECYDIAGSGAISFNTGWTVNSSYYIKTTVNSAYRHAGVWSASKAYISAASGWAGYAFNIAKDYTVVEYLQVQYSGGGAGAYAFAVTSGVANRVILKSCIGDAAGTGTDTFNIRGVAYCVNCLALNGGQGFNFYDTGSGLAYNCTAGGNTNGFQQAYCGSAPVWKNCLSTANTGADFTSTSGTDPTVTYSASEDATADDWSGAGNRISQTFTFTASTYKITAADAGAKDYGTSLSADATYPFAVDCVDTARPQGTAWDIGFYELPVAVSVISDYHALGRGLSRGLSRGFC